MVAFADRRLDRDLDQMGRALADLPGAALRVGSGNVEIAQRAVIERCAAAVREHPLGHQLGRAIGIDRQLRVVLVDRHPLGRAVDRGGRRKEDCGTPAATAAASSAWLVTVLLR